MPKTVLVVEDDGDARAVYGEALAQRGYQVLTASQGAEGVHLARRLRPDLILLDIRMPVLSGWGAIRYLRSYHETRGIPVLAISAYAPAEEELAELEALAGFLMKPIDARTVVAEVVDRIGPPEQASTHPFPRPE